MKYQSDLLNKGLLNDKIEITIKKAPIQTKPALKRYNNSGMVDLCYFNLQLCPSEYKREELNKILYS